MLGDDVARGVFDAALEARDAGRLRRPGIGDRGTRHPEIRSDDAMWVDPESADSRLRPVLDLFEQVAQCLRRDAYLGVRGFETQLAVYSTGAHYQRHRDALARSSRRIATAIYYANVDWEPGHGGELEVWNTHDSSLVPPIADRLVVFLAEQLEHAVRKVEVGPRVAMTAWYRTLDA